MPLKPHSLFLWIALLFGSLMLCVNQPFYGPDEANHFTRIIALSQGHLLSPGYAPASYENFMEAYFHPHSFNPLTIQLPASDPKPVPIDRYNRANVYSPAPYLSALPVVWLTMHAGASPQATFYAARLCIFLTSTLIIYMAIRFTPILQWPMLLIAVYPATIFIRSSVNADPLTLSFAFLFIALLCRTLYSPTSINSKHVLQLSALSVLLCLSKTTYFLIPGMFFLLPLRQFTSRRHYFIALSCIVIFPFLLGMGWLVLASHVQEALPRGNDLNTQVPHSVNAAAQFSFCLKHPLHFLQVVWQTWAETPFISQFLGGQTASDIIQPDKLVLPAVFLLFLLPAQAPQEHYVISLRQRLLCAGLFGVTYLMICMALYTAWTPLGAATLNGIQGRYFAPALPLLLLATAHRISQENYKRLLIFTTLFLIFILVEGLRVLVYHEYPMHGLGA